MMPQASRPTNELRAALRGVRAFLLDLDGVIVTAGSAVPGAAEAIAELERRSVSYRIVTSPSAVSPATLSRWAVKLGAPNTEDRFEQPLSASAAGTARTFPDEPLYV